MNNFWNKILVFLGLAKKSEVVIEQVITDVENTKAVLQEMKAVGSAIVNASTNINPDPILSAAKTAAKQTLEVTKEAAIQQGVEAIKKLNTK